MNYSLFLRLLFLIISLKSFNLLNAQNNNTIENYYKKAVEFEGKNLDSSFYYLEKSYGLSKSKDTINAQFSDILNQYGRLHFYKQDFKTAYFYFNRCFNNSLVLGDEKSAYKVKVNMATCQDKLGNVKEALKDFLDVIAYYEKNDAASLSLGIAYFNVAGLYQKENNYEMAESFYVKCLPFFSERKNSLLQVQANRIGNFNSFDLEKAKILVEELKKDLQFDELPSYLKSLFYNNMARTMKLSSNFEESLVYTFKALEIKKESKIAIDIAIQYQNIGEIYQQINQPEIAVIYLDSALNLATSNRQKLSILKNLQEGYKTIGNANKSLQYADAYIVLKDSLTEVLTKKEIAELGLKYQTKENKNIISRLKQLSSIYKIVLFALLILVFYGVYLFIKKNKNNKKEVAILQNEVDVLKTKHQEVNKESSLIKLKSNAVLKVDEILYVKADGHYVEYFLANKTRPEIDRIFLSDVEKELPSNTFVKIHRSYIVNIYKIKIINSTKLMLDSGEWLNLSRTYKPQLKALLQKEINY